MNVFTLVLLCASSLFSAHALAQWQWVDAQGRKVFSDLPPRVEAAPPQVHFEQGYYAMPDAPPPPPAPPRSPTERPYTPYAQEPGERG